MIECDGDQTMTETIQTQPQTVDGLPVDTTTKYPLDAGVCESCGQYKTWKFKVQNKKSGKMMPGHVTAEGFKIGDGECPKWAKIAEMNKKKAEKKATEAAAPPRPGAWIQDITGGNRQAVVSAASSPALALVPVPVPATAATGLAPGPEPGPVIAFTVNGFTVTTSMTQAAGVIEQISTAMRKILGRGA